MPGNSSAISSYPRYVVFVLLCMLYGASSAMAEPDQATAEGAVLPFEQLFTTQAAQLVFGDPPSIPEETFNMSIKYAHVAKGFWIEQRCRFLSSSTDGEDAKARFTANVGLMTAVMRQTLAREDGYTEASADKDTQKLQMYALNEMSAKGFYQCDQNARAILAYATEEAEVWAQTLSAVKGS